MKKLPGKFPDSERIYLNHGVRPLERAHQAAYGVHARMLDIALCKAFELGLHVVDYRLKAVFSMNISYMPICGDMVEL